MKGAGMPAYFWGEVVTTAIFILNRSSTRSVEGRTPYEAWHGTKPNVHFLRVFGCRAHAKITTPNLKKLDDRSKPMVMLGYEPGGKAYRLYDPVAKRVHVSRDVIFDESAGWDWSIDNMAEVHGEGEFIVEYSHALAPAMTPITQEGPVTTTPASTEKSPQFSATEGNSTHSSIGVGKQVKFATPPSAPNPEHFDIGVDPEMPHRYRRVLDLVEPDAPVS